MKSRSYVSVTINGIYHEISGHQAFLNLSDYLRYDSTLTGTKVVCAEGDCGACTVMCAKADDLEFYSMNSCISPMFLLDGCHIITVEGLKLNDQLCEVQKSMVCNFAGQCGFCTPGFVMSLVNLCEQKPDFQDKHIKNYLTGNLCRCTGYTPIIEAAKKMDRSQQRPLRECYDFKNLKKRFAKSLKSSVLIESGEKLFFAPTSLREAVKFRRQNKECRIYSGATDIGVQQNKGKYFENTKMSLHLVKELSEISAGKKTKKGRETIRVGARVSLFKLQKYLEKAAPNFAEFINIFASPQIKNMATLVGNVMNGSPIADTTPVLMSLNAEMILLGPKCKRRVPLKNFFKGYKKFDLKPGEIVTHIEFEKEKNQIIGCYKVSQRRDLDISCVNAAYVIELDKKNNCVDARVSYGGVGPVPMRMPNVEKALVGSTLNALLAESVSGVIENNVQPISDVRGSAEFRREMSVQLWKKFFSERLSQ